MVKPIIGWTKRGDEYIITGGKSYIKEDGCYLIRFTTIDRVKEVWKVPSKDINLERLMQKLEGPFKVGERGLFGRKFLEKYGKLVFHQRLSR